MNKNIKIEKDIKFFNTINEITAIQLEKKITKKDYDKVEGYLLLSGKHKNDELIEENFSYEIPIEISLTNKLDPDSIEVKISDFSYEIINNDDLKCYIELSLEGVEILNQERECDGDVKEQKEIEIPHININQKRNDDKDDNISIKDEDNIKEEKEDKDENKLFEIDTTKETYGTFIVYIVKENETINTIMEKYHTSLEEIERYNDIKNISIGAKVLIPYLNETDS